MDNLLPIAGAIINNRLKKKAKEGGSREREQGGRHLISHAPLKSKKQNKTEKREKKERKRTCLPSAPIAIEEPKKLPPSPWKKKKKKTDSLDFVLGFFFFNIPKAY